MRAIEGVSIGLVYRRSWAGEGERVLEVKIVDAEGETIANDWITAREVRDWLGLEHPQ